MTIDEAIRIKSLTGDEFLAADPDDIDTADRLSIEALKRVRNIRNTIMLSSNGLLPGETEDRGSK